MALHHDRKSLRQTFDSASEVYHRARPDSPKSSLIISSA